MKLLCNLIVVVGFCLGTLGAAGFGETREPYAMLLFLGGLGLLAAGGLAGRGLRKASRGAEGAVGTQKATFQNLIQSLRDQVTQLDEERASLEPEVVRQRIDELFSGEYFDLTSRHEELAGLVGFSAYAQVWEGVATAERLLARTWSMITDGHAEEGLAELAHARANLERAARAMASL